LRDWSSEVCSSDLMLKGHVRYLEPLGSVEIYVPQGTPQDAIAVGRQEDIPGGKISSILHSITPPVC
jgi:hypothetical protein